MWMVQVAGGRHGEWPIVGVVGGFSIVCCGVPEVMADDFHTWSKWLVPVVRPEVMAALDTRSTWVDTGIFMAC